jgi:small subunit ribosomal protein S2
LPDGIIIVDANLEITAVKEASVLGIPIIALVDSNTDPTPIQYPIPANDDSIRTIQLIMKAIADQILESSGKTPKISVVAEEAVAEEAVAEEPK